MVLVNNQRTGDTGLKSRFIGFKDLVSVSGFESDFAAALTGIAVGRHSIWINAFSIGQSIGVSVPGLRRQLSWGHIQIAPDDGVLVQMVFFGNRHSVPVSDVFRSQKLQFIGG